MIRISVVIPTYNRLDTLKACLQAFEGQSIARDSFELIVANDGASDGTDGFMNAYCAAHPGVRYFRQENSGPAAARNAAVRLARGAYVLFTGDDIIPASTFLEEHLRFLEKAPGTAVLGFTDWDRKMKISDFMGYLEWRGHQFSYWGLTQGKEAPWDRFYTSNISLERKWFDADLFDETFCYPAFEDLELGYRLCQKGLKIVFNREARAFHRHSVGEQEFYNKAWQAGFSHYHFMKKHALSKDMKAYGRRMRFVLSASKGLQALSPVLKVPVLKSLKWELNILYYKSKGMQEALSAAFPVKRGARRPPG